ncbi:hypothetical protein D6779_09415 [Candidatus Parcubacteria bacterium]|nr:MAG: hypothetical protein D6779_09415 [Candidatus Parcubacteria bacterium]
MHQDCPYPERQWQNALEQVQLGGERHYGWGRVRLETPLQTAMHRNIQDPNNFLWEGPIPAHLAAPDDVVLKIGWSSINHPAVSMDLLLGWETILDGSKRVGILNLKTYAPGATIENGPRHFSIGAHGVWHIAGGV